MKPTFLLAAFLGLCLFTQNACRFGPFHIVRGNGNMMQEDRKVDNFRSVSGEGFMNVYLSQGDDFKVHLEGESNILPYITTHVEGDRLIIGTKDMIDVKTNQDLNVYITAPQLRKIELTGSGDIISKTTLTSPDPMSFSVEGSGDVNVAVDAPEVSTSVAGSGKLKLSGQTKTLKVDIAGSGSYSGDGLKSENAKVSILASGDAYVFASVSLNVSIVGSGSVYYWGNPSISNNIVGSGTLIKKD